MAKKIVLISCVSKKLPHKARAENLYASPLFRLNLKFAKHLTPAQIFILSAKYGLIDLNKEVDPYDKTLNEMKSLEIKQWANNVLKQLGHITNLENDEFIFLAGNNYRKYLIPYIKNYKVPMKGLGIGKQLQYLKNKTK